MSGIDAASILDLRDPATLDEPYAAFAALRAQAPVAWHSGLGMYVATSHEACGLALRDRRLGRVFRDRQPEQDWDTFNWLHADSILDCEPPKHTRLRRLVAGAFGRGHVQRLAPRIADLAAGLLDRVGDAEEFDVIADLAEPLPVMVIAELLGFPESDLHLLRPWSQAIVKMYEMDRTAVHDKQAQQACAEFAAYVRELAAHRAKSPGTDLLTDLVQVREGSDKLSERELIATAVLLLNAGHEASVNGLGNGLHSWLAAGQPPIDAADPAAVAQLVEEFLRHDSPSQLFDRTATEPVDLLGTRIEPGEKIAVLLGAANRDPAVFAEPDRFDPAREPNGHLAFGLGIHFCIGAPLARLEMQTSVRELLSRRPRLRLVEAERRDTFVLRGFERLIVA